MSMIPSRRHVGVETIVLLETSRLALAVVVRGVGVSAGTRWR